MLKRIDGVSKLWQSGDGRLMKHASVPLGKLSASRPKYGHSVFGETASVGAYTALNTFQYLGVCHVGARPCKKTKMPKQDSEFLLFTS